MNKAAQELGRLGGIQRAKNLSRAELSEIGRKAGIASAEKRKQRKEPNGSTQ